MWRIIGSLALLAVLSMVLVSSQPISLQDSLQPPSFQHYLGTDQLGRDIFQLSLQGASYSLALAVGVRILTVGIGLLIGGLAGFFGGWIDLVLMRLVDIMLAFPDLLLAIGFSVAFGEPTVLSLAIVLTLVSWPSTARIVRSQVISVKEQQFVEAAYAVGGSGLHILGKHIFPWARPISQTIFFLGLGSTMMAEASLSFFGLGVPTLPTLGILIQQGFPYILTAPWVALGPAALLVILMLVSYQEKRIN